MDYLDDPARSVDDLMNSVYHRVGMLIWTHQYLGYGHARSAGEAVDVLDFGRGATEPISATGVLAFPPNGMTDIPIYGASETPDPLPPNGRYPIGYPMTLQPLFGSALRLIWQSCVTAPGRSSASIQIHLVARTAAMRLSRSAHCAIQQPTPSVRVARWTT
jgi:hypothetical protein